MNAIATPTAPPASSLPSAVLGQRLYRISVDQYHQMAKHGILKPSDRVVLLRGFLVEKMTKNPPHILATGLTRSGLEPLVSKSWFLNVQDPIALADSEPEPDISVIRGQRRQFQSRLPKPADIGILIEVSDSSLADDRTIQLQLYAEAKIPAYWIVNLIDQQIEVYTDPSGPAAQPSYSRHQIFRIGDMVPVVLDGAEVGRLAVRDLLP